MRETEAALDGHAAEAEATDRALRGEDTPETPMEAFRRFVADVVADYRKAVAEINADRDRAVAEVKGQVQMALLIGAGRCGIGPDEAQKVVDKIQRGDGF